ncbi:MAG: NAD(P)/FAD-dependent oxidoreductase [Vulcanimicrobiaceae bacterium]
MKHASGADVIVVGAGIVGAACLYFLALAGVEAVLVERGSIAGGTSGSGEGNVLVSDKDPGPELELAKQGVALWRELAATLADFEYERKGGVIVAFDGDELDRLRARGHRLESSGVRAELLDPLQARALEPNLTERLAGALYVRDDAQVQPMAACRALIDAARWAGARVDYGTTVLEIQRDTTGAVCGVRTSGGTVEARTVIVACGPWTPDICATLGARLPILPRKGHIVVTESRHGLVQHKVYEANYGETVNSGDAELQFSAVVEETKSGTLLLGSSREFAGFDASIRQDAVAEIARRAVRLFPCLERVSAMRAYVGFRPFVPDHLPLIGELRDVPGLYINAGHEGAGIGLGPVSARLLAQRLTGSVPALDLAPFDPNRFMHRATESVHAS